MKKFRTKHRLVPLETLYPNRPAIKTPKKAVPFVKPGVSAKIPAKTEEQPCVRFLQASTILKDLKTLEGPLKDIEEDASFITSAMDAALRVPKAIDSTFSRIHGRIYDIQREIEYSSNSLDENATTIQKNFRAYRVKGTYATIKAAIRNTMKRDCSMIHECLLGFLLSYAKKDEDFQIITNRRFMIRNRHALKYWRKWCDHEKEENQKRKERIAQLQETWLNRQCAAFLVKWKELSFSKHSRKAVRALGERIMAEAQRRISETVMRALDEEAAQEMLEEERQNVIIEYARDNYQRHMTGLTFRLWRFYVVQCKKAARTGNALAREFRVMRTKKSFFTAWFSLSVGRVIVFGGYSHWHRPVNRLKQYYVDSFKCQKNVLDAWRWLCVRHKRLDEFAKRRERAFLRKVLLEFRDATVTRMERLSNMMEGYIVFLKQRMHKVFDAWHFYTAKERVRKRPIIFILRRSEVMRKYRLVKSYYRRWTVRFRKRQTVRYREEIRGLDGYISHWASAGNEMRESMDLISHLMKKLKLELARRKEDLTESLAAASFMRDEQKSLALAMRATQFEIEKMHSMIDKSSMRYFVDIKPIHGDVVADVPGALAHYMELKEQEKQRLAQKATAPVPPIRKQARRDSLKRRKTTFIQPAKQKTTSTSSRGARPRKGSLQAGTERPEISDK